MVLALLILGLFLCSVNASDIINTELIDIAKEDAKKAAINFLQDYTYNIYLYQSNDLESHTALSLSSNVRSDIAAPSSNFACFTETRRISDELALNDKSSYLLEKAEYKTKLYNIQDVVHTQFCVAYEVQSLCSCSARARLYVQSLQLLQIVYKI